MNKRIILLLSLVFWSMLAAGSFIVGAYKCEDDIMGYENYYIAKWVEEDPPILG